MRSTLIALVATIVLSAPVLARAHDCCCDDCCDSCADSAQSSPASSVDADAILKVLAQYGFYLGPYADQIGESGGISISSGDAAMSSDDADADEALDAAAEAQVIANLRAMAAHAAEPADPDDSLHTFVFHCPVNFNSGEPIPQDKLDALEKHLCELAGGFTMSEAEGAWVNEGKLYHEPMRRYMIGTPYDGIDALEDYAVDTLKQDFGQINVWVEVDGEAKIL